MSNHDDAIGKLRSILNLPVSKLKELIPQLENPEKVEAFSQALTSFLEMLNISRDKKFTFLLLGRTGVGKSSTVNSLMGMDAAPTDPFEPTTMDVHIYEHESNNIHFTVIDTPGLCDDIEESENDESYLELIHSKVEQVDLLWFITPLDETRVRTDEKRGIRLISEAFGSKLWEHSIIVFTFADKVSESDFLRFLEKRTELIRKEIAKNLDDPAIAETIPSIAVTNRSKQTPDGKNWLGELYTKVFVRMSERGAFPFLLATANRVKKEPNWRFYDEFNSESNQSENAGYSFSDFIDLNAVQRKLIQEKLLTYVPAFAAAGAGIGAMFGPIGAAIGGVTGAGLGFVASIFG